MERLDGLVVGVDLGFNIRNLWLVSRFEGLN